MKGIRKFQLFILFAIMGCGSLGAGEPFSGVLAYTVQDKKVTTPLRYYSDGQHIRIEAGKKGDPHLIWLGGLEAVDGIAFLIPFNKSYSIEPAGARGWPGPQDSWDGKKKPKEKRAKISDPVPVDYMGLECSKYTIKTDGQDVDVWILGNATVFPLTVLRLWDTLRETAPAIYRLCQEQAGVPLQIQRKNWRGKSVFSMTLDSVEAYDPDPKMFAIPENYAWTRSAYAPESGDSGEGKRGPPPGRESGGPPRGNKP